MNKEVGIMLSEIPFSNIPIIFKNSGLDFFILDCEHGVFDYSDVLKIITTSKLCGIKAIIRLPDNSRRDIIRFMDMGASGLLLPMTNTAKDIEQVVAYAKYKPMGQRGISTMRAHTLYNPPNLSEYMKSANEKTEIYAQIETAMGVNNLEEILSVKGVDGCFVGPNDLSCDYDCLADNNAEQILSAIKKVANVAKKLDKIAGIITANKNYLKTANESNFTHYCKGSELNAIANYSKNIVSELK